MNTDQLKQLKPGDEIFFRARYKRILGDGNVLFLHSALSAYDKEIKTEGYTHPKNVILPPPAPKQDTFRPLKKGDKVRPCPWRYRRPTARLGATRIIPDTRVLEVASDELHEHVALIYGDDVIEMHICFLELVTPVEELEPYKVDHNQYGWHIEKDGEVIATYNDERHPHAKEAAEAERDRLNAEHRKEQNNE